MTEHLDVQAATSRLHRAAIRFERQAHLGQPIRSHAVYQLAIDTLRRHLDSQGPWDPDRYGLSEARGRILFASKHLVLVHGREPLIADIDQTIAEINQLTEQVKNR